MKLFIISDIHGSLYYLKKVMEIFEKENYDKLVILGDELYHGPRNPLPKDYSPKEVIEILNKYKDKIIAVRGNCDSEVDQMVLSYPIMSDYSMIYLRNKRVFLTHGHIYNIDNPLPMSEGDILLYGHFHIPMIEKKEERYFFNPGSISLPKNNSNHSFALLDETKFQIKDLDENILMEINF
jgi:putative phosphoesterase